MNLKKILSFVALTACLIGCCSCGQGSDNGGASGDIMEEWQGGKVIEQQYADTYRLSDSLLLNAPTVVCDVNSESALNGLRSATWTPSNAVLRFSKNYNVLSSDGKKLDSFANIYDKILKGKIIPVLYLENDECADAAITFFSERMQISDLAVMSAQPSVVKKVRTAYPTVRGILAYDTLESPEGVAQTANEALAATVVIPQSAASVENVRYIQSRFKTVWVKAESGGDTDLFNCLGSGAYGIVSAEFSKAYALISDCAKGVTRTPFNVGHRGLPATHHENSVSGTRAAIAAGATHVELDGYLSKDGHIVMMHNADIGATTNGSGVIAEMTLEEIRQYKLNKKGAEEEIPTLEDIIDVLKGTDCVLLFEIKGGGSELIDKLKEIVEEKDFAEQLTVISFASDYISYLHKTMPNIPSALLANSMTTDSIEKLVSLNTGISVNYTSVMTEEFENYYKDRGMTGWYWTFTNVSQAISAADRGFVGLTNDVAGSFISYGEQESVMLLKPLDSYAALPSLAVGSKIDLKGITYRGTEVVKTGTVRYVQELNGKYAVVATCDTEKDSLVYSPRLYTQVFYIDKE